MPLSVKIAALAIATAALAGCGSVPIMNVTEAPIATASGKPLSNEQVRSAIVRAGAALGWQMKEEGPGMLTGTLQLRNHTAVVAIPYSPKSYSVQYRTSVNLDEKGGNIHKNYNGWIQNLTRGINAQLSAS
jgi:type IV pilus biogenesis protein CpaD/CtpE